MRMIIIMLVVMIVTVIIMIIIIIIIYLVHVTIYILKNFTNTSTTMHFAPSAVISPSTRN